MVTPCASPAPLPRDTDACVTVELLPLDPSELFVAVVRDVSVEMRDGDVRRARAAAAASTARWSSLSPSSSSSDEEEDDESSCASRRA